MGYTVPGLAVDGAVAPASLWNDGVRTNFETATPHILVRKTADESVTSSTALQNDDHLFFAMTANDVWYVRVGLRVFDASASVADLKVAFTVPASATAALTTNHNKPGGGPVSRGAGTLVGSSEQFDISNTDEWIEIYGLVMNAGTAGNFQMQWAQVVSNASAVTVKTNSCILGFKLA
jgi:hypothetical protein